MVDDGPGGGAGALPEGDPVWDLSAEVADLFAEVGDGSGFGGAERRTRVFFFEFCHGVGQERSKGAGIVEVNGLEREAALLIEETDVAGGEVGGFGRGIVDDGNANAMAVTDEGCFERTELLKVAKGFVRAEND